MPYEWPVYVTGILALVLLVVAAGLLGWLAARLFLHATRQRANAADRHAEPR